MYIIHIYLHYLLTLYLKLKRELKMPWNHHFFTNLFFPILSSHSINHWNHRKPHPHSQFHLNKYMLRSNQLIRHNANKIPIRQINLPHFYFNITIGNSGKNWWKTRVLLTKKAISTGSRWGLSGRRSVQGGWTESTGR